MVLLVAVTIAINVESMAASLRDAKIYDRTSVRHLVLNDEGPVIIAVSSLLDKAGGAGIIAEELEHVHNLVSLS